jgi:hypothetical protein
MVADKWVKITFSASERDKNTFYSYLQSKGIKPWQWFQLMVESMEGNKPKPVIRDFKAESEHNSTQFREEP